VAQGVFPVFHHGRNFARNKDWEIILDRLIHLREVEKLDLSLIIQVTRSATSCRTFISSAGARASEDYIGLENINPANLQAAKKKQNKITNTADLLEWQKAGILVYRLHHRIPRYGESILTISRYQAELPIDSSRSII